MTTEAPLIAHCLKCREKREIQNAVDDVFKNGTPIKKGVCGVCGNTLFRIQKRPAAT